ncbi:MAG: hypothetical protein ACYDHP_01745 [Ferrimicrobium sp.]
MTIIDDRFGAVQPAFDVLDDEVEVEDGAPKARSRRLIAVAIVLVVIVAIAAGLLLRHSTSAPGVVSTPRVIRPATTNPSASTSTGPVALPEDPHVLATSAYPAAPNPFTPIAQPSSTPPTGLGG